jgi:hypothetical protein
VRQTHQVEFVVQLPVFIGEAESLPAQQSSDRDRRSSDSRTRAVHADDMDRFVGGLIAVVD